MTETRPPSMPRQHLIGNLRHTRAAMQKTAKLLREAGIADHADEMEGAARIVTSWIDGIAQEDEA